MQWEHKYSAPLKVCNASQHRSQASVHCPGGTYQAAMEYSTQSSHQSSVISHQSLVTSIPDRVSTPATTPPYIEAWPLKYAFTRSLLSAYQCES